MFGRDLTPPPSGRLSSSSESPDSLYKSSTDSSRTLNFSPDSTRTSTACKAPNLPALPKFRLDDDDSDNEWDVSMASPLQKRPPSLRKINRARSRFSDASSGDSSPANKENHLRPPTLSSPLATPPHKRLRALQINDITHASPVPGSSCRSPLRPKRFSPRGSLFNNNGSSSSCGRRSLKTSPACAAKRPSANPFTPIRNSPVATVQSSVASKRGRMSHPAAVTTDSGFSDDSWLLDIGKHDSSSEMDTDQKLALQEMSTSRYKEEFCEECVVGSGEFGTVFKCVNKLDGCTYAIKRSREPVAGSAFERVARNEVYAHAVLGKHSHVVRYYSAWAENGHLYIQNEYCNGGSLAEEIAMHQKRGTRFTEAELKDILKQVAHGLKYIHAQQLVHMDIKPANIFIQYNPLIYQSPESGIEDDSSDSELNDKITYKIGDFGHVTSLNAEELEEGDCRYLPKEILSDDHSHLTKADVFALGLIIFQAATLSDLPKNGDHWHAIREGQLPHMKGYSTALNNIVKKMVSADPEERPPAAVIASHPELCPTALRSRKELARELNEERFKNQQLAEQLKAVQEHAELKTFGFPAPALTRPTTRVNRLVGIKVNRSKSLTNF